MCVVGGLCISQLTGSRTKGHTYAGGSRTRSHRSCVLSKQTVNTRIMLRYAISYHTVP